MALNGSEWLCMVLDGSALLCAALLEAQECGGWGGRVAGLGI